MIYLDHAATTPVHPEVLEAMLPYFTLQFGNPSSLHAYGRDARIAVSRARDEIAGWLGCSPSEWLFTGSGTESDNTALFGAASRAGEKRHIVTTQVEHHAVLHACERLEQLGFEVTYLPVDATGRVSVEEVQASLRPDTFLISVMYANNEVGTVQPIVEIGELARSRGVLFHVDAVQALGTLPIRLNELPVDLMSFSAHKIYGPKGVGGLYAHKAVHIAPHLYGGSQERKRRAGTENVPGIVGFAKAMRLAGESRDIRVRLLEELREELIAGLNAEVGSEHYRLNGHPTERLPQILNVSFPGASTDTMLMNLDLNGIAAASGSACTSGSLEVSHVLKAMQLPDEVTGSAIRFSMGTTNEPSHMREVSRRIGTILRRVRSR
ncbi:cysteine desulfurase family protein [Paenibacillus koleovorans]|uniref:cysteine desulfurase family protein n=1 Tax=Paenibacillus koleovorans TaxID=121608 RepID=UPI000FD72D43|nr:cysteine desulfurase family protein [Paenibacillus koleovorans]